MGSGGEQRRAWIVSSSHLVYTTTHTSNHFSGRPASSSKGEIKSWLQKGVRSRLYRRRRAVMGFASSFAWASAVSVPASVSGPIKSFVELMVRTSSQLK